MKIITAYKCSNGIYEEDKTRAYAWELAEKYNISFSQGLIMLQDIKGLQFILKEYSNE